MRQIIITAKIMDPKHNSPPRENHELSVFVSLITFTHELWFPTLEPKNWFLSVAANVGDGVHDSATDTVSLVKSTECNRSGDIDLDASLSLIRARSLSTFFKILLTFFACLLLQWFLELWPVEAEVSLSISSSMCISSPIPTSEEASETLNGLLATSDE